MTSSSKAAPGAGPVPLREEDEEEEEEEELLFPLLSTSAALSLASGKE